MNLVRIAFLKPTVYVLVFGDFTWVAK